ncbi:MAG TPA: DUF3386 family protein [Leptolyngbyaceae cyanobacterium]
MIKQLMQPVLTRALRLFLAIALFTCALPNLAFAQSASDAFRTAYENRYTWDEDFPGYSAEVSINYQGQLDQGIVRVKPDLTVEAIDIDRDEAREFVVNQLKMEVIHRRRVPFDKIHEPDSFQLEGKDTSGAWKIREVGDEMNSHYKVKNNMITQVNRVMGEVAVTVNTIGTAKTPEGYLVTHFQTIIRDAETNEVLEKEDVRDFHEKIGKYYLLTNREIRTTEAENPDAKLVPDTLVRFNDVQPL